MTTISRARRALAAATFPLVLLLPLAGCGGSSSDAPVSASSLRCAQATSLVLVVGVHQNMTKPGVPAELECTISTAISNGATIAVVAVDGTPHFALSPTIIPVVSKNLNPTAHSDDVKAGIRQLLATVKATKSTSNGSDLMTALSLAAGVRKGDRPFITVIDSGLPDTGSLRMTDPGMTGASANDVVATLKSANALPDLNKTHVMFIGVGWTVNPQKTLIEAQRRNIVKIWAEIITASAGTPETSPTPRTDAGPTTTFTTKTVSPAPPPIFAPPQPNATPQPLTFDDTTVVHFAPDSATLTDPDAVATALTPVATWLKDNPSRHVSVTGRTSSGRTAWPDHKTLGKARADAVAQVLVNKLAVPPRQVTTMGAGYSATPPDGGPDHLDSGKAALNRAVILSFNLT